MKSYTDSRSPKQLSKINNELADVQRIMVQNIEDVIQRGEQLSGSFIIRFKTLLFLLNPTCPMLAAKTENIVFGFTRAFRKTTSRNSTNRQSALRSETN